MFYLIDNKEVIIMCGLTLCLLFFDYGNGVTRERKRGDGVWASPDLSPHGMLRGLDYRVEYYSGKRTTALPVLSPRRLVPTFATS